MKGLDTKVLAQKLQFVGHLGSELDVLCYSTLLTAFGLPCALSLLESGFVPYFELKHASRAASAVFGTCARRPRLHGNYGGHRNFRNHGHDGYYRHNEYNGHDWDNWNNGHDWIAQWSVLLCNRWDSGDQLCRGYSCRMPCELYRARDTSLRFTYSCRLWFQWLLLREWHQLRIGRF